MPKPPDLIGVDFNSPPSQKALENAQTLKDIADRRSALLPPGDFMKIQYYTRKVLDASYSAEKN